MMTGIQSGEKKSEPVLGNNPDKMTIEQPRRSKSSLIVTAVVACVVTTGIIGSVVASLYFGTHMCQGPTKPSEPKTYFLQISDSPAAAKVEVHRPERVIITETSSTDKKLDDTVTLQDYNRDLQAVKDQVRDECYVFPVFYDYDEALKLAEDNTTTISMDEEETMDLKMNRTMEAIPREVLQHAVGAHIADFCSDVPTYWLLHATSEDSARVKRSVHWRIKISITIRF